MLKSCHSKLRDAKQTDTGANHRTAGRDSYQSPLGSAGVRAGIVLHAVVLEQRVLVDLADDGRRRLDDLGQPLQPRLSNTQTCLIATSTLSAQS